jgi:hypothetical protein
MRRSVCSSRGKLAFEEWTKTCVADLADQLSDVAKKLNAAQQGDAQPPWKFHY